MEKYAYIRVSTKEQNIDRQLVALKPYGIADLVLQVMAYFAQTERESIHQRQAEGIAAAKSKGKHLGRKPEPLPTDFECICTRCDSGEISTRMAAIDLGMSHSTFYRHFCSWKSEKAVSNGRQSGTPLKA